MVHSKMVCSKPQRDNERITSANIGHLKLSNSQNQEPPLATGNISKRMSGT